MTAILGVGSGGSVVTVSACMNGTRGLGVLSSTCDVLEMSVVRGVGGVCDMCMCLARGGVGGEGGEWMRKLGLGFTNPVRDRGSVGHVSVFWLLIRTPVCGCIVPMYINFKLVSEASHWVAASFLSKVNFNLDVASVLQVCVF